RRSRCLRRARVAGYMPLANAEVRGPLDWIAALRRLEAHSVRDVREAVRDTMQVGVRVTVHRLRSELLHEARDARVAALRDDGPRPRDVERTRAGAALSADDDPVDGRALRRRTKEHPAPRAHPPQAAERLEDRAR